MHQLCQEGFVRAFFVILLQLRGLRLVVGSKYDVKSWCSHWLASHRCHPHLAKNHFYTGFLHEDSWGSIDVIFEAASATAKLLQSCPTLCNPIDSSPLGSPVPGILQARILEWVAISFSNAWKWKVKGKLLSRVWRSATPWTATLQAPPSTGFSRQEYWSGVPLPSLDFCSSTL